MDPKFRYTIALLSEYSSAALQNAEELLEEASSLLAGAHRARAYFMAVAGIEEIGKAILAFDGQGRNLGDSAVTAKLRRAMEDHSQKVTAAFSPVLIASPNLRESLMPIIDLMIHVKNGREPSMYVDINYESSRVQVPSAVVREVAARDCVRLAFDCLGAAKRHIAQNPPRKTTPAEDAFFAMKSSESQKIMHTEAFWWYYIEQFRADGNAFSMAIVSYQREYLSKGRVYNRLNRNDSGGDEHAA